MAKNMQNYAFRKIDVDVLNEDAYREEDEVPESPSIGPDEQEVNRFLSGGQLEGALAAALKNPPIRSKHKPTRDQASKLVLKVLTSFKSADITKAVPSLDRDQIGVLMKYLYKGFEMPFENSSAILLVWHDKLYDVVGEGGIVRVLTDPRRL